MEYTKPALTYEQQADLAILKGLGADRDELVACLESIGYYRLSGYWHILKDPPTACSTKTRRWGGYSTSTHSTDSSSCSSSMPWSALRCICARSWPTNWRMTAGRSAI